MRAGGRRTEKRTWMSSWSDRQASEVTASGRFGARTIERDIPPNMRKMGDFVYSRPSIRQQSQAQGGREKTTGALVVSLSHLSLATARFSIFLDSLYPWTRGWLVRANMIV